MSGKNNFVAKAICRLMSTAKMIGGEVDKGLAGLETSVESGA